MLFCRFFKKQKKVQIQMTRFDEFFKTKLIKLCRLAMKFICIQSEVYQMPLLALQRNRCIGR